MKNPKGFRAEYASADRSTWKKADWAKHEKRILAHAARVEIEEAAWANVNTPDKDEGECDDDV